jgi:hypothetical protein
VYGTSKVALKDTCLSDATENERAGKRIEDEHASR